MAKEKKRGCDVYDLAALAYIYKRVKETERIREASHIVIDEAQDFGMMAYESLHFCIPRCSWTIMGDAASSQAGRRRAAALTPRPGMPLRAPGFRAG